MHSYRFRKHGDPLVRLWADKSVAERLEELSEGEALTGCLLWCGVTTPAGYGQISVKGKTQFAHRIAYEQAFGPIPDGLSVCHRCDTPQCIRPAHLFLGTNTENIADSVAKGRKPNGERVWKAKLTRDDVISVRARCAEGESLTAIANAYGVTKQAIALVRDRKNWKHVA